MFDIFHTSFLYIPLVVRYYSFPLFHHWYIHLGFFLHHRYIHIGRPLVPELWDSLYILHLIHVVMGFYHWVFEPSFLSFLSLYYLSLRYVLSLKTTLKPWYHALCFNSSYVGNIWDWFKSTLIMMVQELWYDPTLGHSHLREFFIGYVVILLDTLHWGTLSLVGGWFLDDHYVEAYFSQSMMGFWAMFVPRRISDVFFHIGAWDMIGIFHLVYFTLGHTPLRRWWILSHIRFLLH